MLVKGLSTIKIRLHKIFPYFKTVFPGTNHTLVILAIELLTYYVVANVQECLINISPLIRWIHNDSMYVGYGGMRNTKTWSKFNLKDDLKVPH